MPSIHELLAKYWGHSSFRPLQEDIINSLLSGNDTLALLPTGGGKSICFQIPALALEGICIVVSPLIALMKDQVENLNKRGIQALAIYSGMKTREIDVALDNCVHGKVKFLYLSPERLGSDIVRVRLQKMKICFLAIDEAHCISQWGYDFRPAYLRIAELRELLPKLNVLALTATATPEVVIDIQKQLSYKKQNVFQASFQRNNLSYVVLTEEDKWNRLLKIATNIQGTGIVYARNRRKTQEIAEFLNRHGISSDFYHAGLDPKNRDEKQGAWMLNKCRVIVCTNAFGMGIDKPEVRFVVHLEPPDSLEAYFQEAGRAGRDGKKSYAVLLYHPSDAPECIHRLEQGFPVLSEIKKVYQALANYYQLAIGAGLDAVFDFDISSFCSNFNFKPNPVFNCLKFLEKQEFIALSENANNNSKLKLLLNKQELYNFQIANKKYDDFLKTILRSYSGAFDDFIAIQENELAKRTELKKEDVVKNLTYLNQIKVLSYLPQTFLPQVTFTSERIDVKQLSIDPEILKFRAELARKKLEAVIHYAQSTQLCRSQILLKYFGESNSKSCGVCDVCLKKNKSLDISLELFESLAQAIQVELTKECKPIKELVKALNHRKEKQSLQVIQHLLDSGKIKAEKELLYWKN
jgi:ATP-dependent DNA helicase RecQ